MLGDTIKTLRTKRGLTQEELAIRLHVVRQTVSKWEKGLSTPDAEMLRQLADELEVSVQELLGGEIREEASQDEIAQQLARLNEHMAVRNRRTSRIIKGLCIGMAALLVLILGMAAAGIRLFSAQTAPSPLVPYPTAADPEMLTISDVQIDRLPDGSVKCTVRTEDTKPDGDYALILTHGNVQTVFSASAENDTATSGDLAGSASWKDGVLTADLGKLPENVPYDLTLRVQQPGDTGIYLLVTDLMLSENGGMSWVERWKK